MQLGETVRYVVTEINAEFRIALADPVTGSPQSPNAAVQGQANALYSNMKWVAAVIAVFCVIAGGIMMGVAHSRGGENPGLGRVGATFAGLGVVAAAATVVGVATGV